MRTRREPNVKYGRAKFPRKRRKFLLENFNANFLGPYAPEALSAEHTFKSIPIESSFSTPHLAELIEQDHTEMEYEYEHNQESEHDQESEQEDWEDATVDPKFYNPEQNRQPANYSGSYGPYFPSYTTASLSLFLAQTRLSRQHFDSLLKIIKHPEFSVNDLPKTYSQCKRLLRGVPSLPILQRDLEVTCSRARSAMGTTEPAYTHSVTDIVKRVLCTKRIRDRMHFGAGQKVKRPKELYHGQLWRESAIFGDDHVHVREGLYSLLLTDTLSIC